METKFELRLNTQYDTNTLLSAFANGLAFEFLLDEVRGQLRDANGIEKADLFDGVQVIAGNGADVGFTTVQEWIANKATAQADLLSLVVVMDSRLAEANQIVSGELSEGTMSKITDFLLKVNAIEITDKYVDVKDTGVRGDFVENIATQLALVSENEFLVGLSSMKLKPVPLETKSYANTFIEEKLNKLNALCDKLTKKLDTDFDGLQDLVADLNDKLYAISNEPITDGEKVDAARKALKAVNSHRQVVDKVEDALIEGVELVRQLTIHENKLKVADADKLSDSTAKIAEAENIDTKTQIERDMVSMRFMNDQYLAGIKVAQARVKALKERVEEYRKTVENLDLAFKSSIPTESEMKKYSSIKHRLQDLQNRLEISGGQIAKDKDTKEILSVAKAGLDTLVEIFTEGKDLFMRNNLMSGVFASLNCIYNLGENEDKELEKSQRKFISEKLEDYSIRNASMLKDLTTFRRVGDEAIRDIAIVLGKPLSAATLYEMAEIQELAINQSNQMFEMIDKSHRKQLELLLSIINID
ncbi:MAG: hypothetical protein E7354_04885 [Clostridiales bacterium]|nr:hypothetical protein [Clostridiales bacterium]